MFYLVALIEGFSTLAVEIIAIRQAAPIVGSSIVLTSIFLGVILLALSAGYYIGGFVAHHNSRKRLIKILGGYLIFSGLFYLLVTFGQEQALLVWLLEKVNNYILTLFIASIILFFFPVFIASQTMPILTELIEEKSKGKAAGKILFASTLGSFLGSVLTSIVLFQTIGVQHTARLVALSLFISTSLLRRKTQKKRSIIVVLLTFILGIIFLFSPNKTQKDVVYSFDSAYQEITIKKGTRAGLPIKVFHTNGSFASAIFIDTKRSPFKYIREAIFQTKELQAKNILVIGTAGFTYPYELASKFNFVEHIDAVDIDPVIKNIAEKYFLESKIPKKVTFYPYSARYFLHQVNKRGKKYDLVFLDAFNGKSLPSELTTIEFFQDIQKILTTKGVVMANFIFDTEQKSNLSRSLLASMSSVFGKIYTKNVSKNKKHKRDNFITSTKKFDDKYIVPFFGKDVYTDDKRSTEFDSVKMYRGRQQKNSNRKL